MSNLKPRTGCLTEAFLPPRRTAALSRPAAGPSLYPASHHPRWAAPGAQWLPSVPSPLQRRLLTSLGSAAFVPARPWRAINDAAMSAPHRHRHCASISGGDNGAHPAPEAKTAPPDWCERASRRRSPAARRAGRTPRRPAAVGGRVCQRSRADERPRGESGAAPARPKRAEPAGPMLEVAVAKIVPPVAGMSLRSGCVLTDCVGRLAAVTD